tara:strand:+ start:82 stop:309 length:228 start_codon:yes stop_codon:yes gene_type:complete
MSFTDQEVASYMTARSQRAYHYAKTCDPMMAQFVAGEITKEEWQQKKQEIKDSLPYPEGVVGSEIEQHCKEQGLL